MTLPSRITTEPIGTSPCAAAAAASSNASCIATSSSTGRNGNGDGRQPEEPEEAAGRRKGAGVGRQGDEFNTERSGGAGAVRAKHSGGSEGPQGCDHGRDGCRSLRSRV